VTKLLAQTCCVDTSPLHSGGAVDDTMQFLFTWVFWLSVVLGVIVAGLLLYAYFRFRRRSDDDEPAQVHGNTRLEIAWTIVPLVIFLSLFGLTAYNMPFVNDTPAAAPMSVTVIGQQFSWTFDYGGGQTGKRVQSFGTLYVPMNTQVGLQVVSTDPPCTTHPTLTQGQAYSSAISAQGCGVNHSFFVPSLAGQINAIPGQVNHLWLNARQGTYYGQCTELCGVGHAQMLLTVIALPMNDFESCVFGNPTINPSSPSCKAGGS
jgi:cytochrome c oxidase subunit II